MENGEIAITICGPKAEMKTFYNQIKSDQPFEEMTIELDTDSWMDHGVRTDYLSINAGYARGTDEMIDTWKKENPHWDITCSMHIYGWGPVSVHHFDNKEWHDYELDDIDADDMDPICENLVGTFGLEDEYRPDIAMMMECA